MIQMFLNRIRTERRQTISMVHDVISSPSLQHMRISTSIMGTTMTLIGKRTTSENNEFNCKKKTKNKKSPSRSACAFYILFPFQPSMLNQRLEKKTNSRFCGRRKR